MHKQSLQQIVRLFIVLLAIIAIILFLKLSIVYLYPFLFAILLSLLLNPFVSFLEEKVKLPRALAAIIMLFSLFIIIVGGIILIISELVQGTTYLANKIPAFFNTLVSYVENFINSSIMPFYQKLLSLFHTLNPDRQQTVKENIEQIINQLGTAGTDLLQNLLFNVPAALGLLPSSITILTLIALATFFITKDWYRLQHSIKKIIPPIANDSGRNVWNHLKKALFGFLKAQLILILVTAIIIFIGLRILQIDHALTISFFAAIVDLFPYIGTGIIFVPWIIYLFISGNYALTIGISILYMIIIIGRQILEPKILSSTIGINPLLALIVLFLGLQLWGVIGIIAAPIIVVVLSALYQSGLFKQLFLYIKG
ncbi:sporulation integral membrane protein YtvI [Virgibacillus oceani]|uniref:Permease n=1 Tax=Virgibacillus oceani TaxID=1479511 RepID=A0A917LXC7_9BACI|nr:sporulation integral membrane protein YtvI [Virgibacillus oceani]GGG61826.1 permease [Virgibacillus oceani]